MSVTDTAAAHPLSPNVDFTDVSGEDRKWGRMGGWETLTCKQRFLAGHEPEI